MKDKLLGVYMQMGFGTKLKLNNGKLYSLKDIAEIMNVKNATFDDFIKFLEKANTEDEYKQPSLF